jgi:tRNA(fMet)-specific endonuclease VapC
MRVCLDSCFIIDILHNEPEAALKLKELEAENAALLVSAVAVYECYVGCFHRPKPNHLESLHGLLKTLRVIPLDTKIAIAAAKAQGELLQQGMPSKIIDLLIGISAIQEDAIILTRDTDDFQKIPGLTVQSW